MSYENPGSRKQKKIDKLSGKIQKEQSGNKNQARLQQLKTRLQTAKGGSSEPKGTMPPLDTGSGTYQGEQKNRKEIAKKTSSELIGGGKEYEVPSAFLPDKPHDKRASSGNAETKAFLRGQNDNKNGGKIINAIKTSTPGNGPMNSNSGGFGSDFSLGSPSISDAVSKSNGTTSKRESKIPQQLAEEGYVPTHQIRGARNTSVSPGFPGEANPERLASERSIVKSSEYTPSAGSPSEWQMKSQKYNKAASEAEFTDYIKSSLQKPTSKERKKVKKEAKWKEKDEKGLTKALARQAKEEGSKKQTHGGYSVTDADGKNTKFGKGSSTVTRRKSGKSVRKIVDEEGKKLGKIVRSNKNYKVKQTARNKKANKQGGAPRNPWGME